MDKISALNCMRTQVNDELKTAKKKRHKEFYTDNKQAFRILDILVILAICFNFGAAATTNILLVEETPEVEIMEVNPVHAEQNNYETHPESSSLMWALVKQALIWFGLIAVYVYYRTNTYNYAGLYFMYILIVYYFFITGYDFFNDLGFLIGRGCFGA